MGRHGTLRNGLNAIGILLVLLAAPAPARAAGPDDLAALRQKALAAVNADRQAHGLAALDLGSALDQAAQAHAEDMLKRRYFSHTSPEGDGVRDRFTDAGGSRWVLVEENIARCAACRPPATGGTVEQLEDGWMHSPHHRANILRDGLEHFGYGIAVDADGGLYADQTFSGPGTPRGTDGDEAAKALSGDAVPTRAAQLIDRAREKAGKPDLRVSPALNQAAQALLPDPGTPSVALKHGGDVLDAVPAGERAGWREVYVLEGACGGCGTEATEADLRFFRQRWLDDPRDRDRLLDPGVSAVGVALQADGTGRKVLVAVLGVSR